MQIISIAAVADNNVIGTGTEIPWKIPEDWERFKARTTGNYLVMGRATYEQIGRPLPNRTTIVVTRRDDFVAPAPQGATRVLVAHTIDEAITMASTDRMQARDHTIFIGGGGEIYAQTMDLATGLDITKVHQSPEGSTFYPEIDPAQWDEISREPHGEFDYLRYAPITYTDRLMLRPAMELGNNSYQLLWAGEADTFASGQPFRSFADAQRRLNDSKQSWLVHGLGFWHAYERESGALVGVGGVRAVVLPNGDTGWKMVYRFVGDQAKSDSAELVSAALAQLKRIDPLARVRAELFDSDAELCAFAEQLGLERLTTGRNTAGQRVEIYQGVVRELV